VRRFEWRQRMKFELAARPAVISHSVFAAEVGRARAAS
jgi:hypothetical protein